MGKKFKKQGSLGDALMKAVQKDPSSDAAKVIEDAVHKNSSAKSGLKSRSSVIPVHWKRRSKSKSSPEFKSRRATSSPRPSDKKKSTPVVKVPDGSTVKVKDGVTIVRHPMKGAETKVPRLTPSRPAPQVPKPGNRDPDPLDWNQRTKLGTVLKQSPEAFPFAGFQPHWNYHEDDQDGELDLVIGLDFGTAFTKVVISESGGQRSWAVPLSTNEKNPYLLKSEVYLSRGVFGLQPGGDRYSGLKIPFLTRGPSCEECERATAFLAGVINYVKQWMMNEQSQYLAGMTPYWWLHVGLPAKDFEDQSLLDRYETTAWAAFTLSAKPAEMLTQERVRLAHEQAWSAYQSGTEEIEVDKGCTTHKDQVDIYPEIMAQMYGFLRSRDWDPKKPEFMLVDVGGGTLDSTIFNVIKEGESGNLEFSTFLSRVDPLGALELHWGRLKWILHELEYGDQDGRLAGSVRDFMEDGTFWLVPEGINSYLQHAKFGDYTWDDGFIQEVREAIYAQHLRVLLEKINPGFINHNRSYPLILAGGGARNELFCRAVKNDRVFHDVGIELLNLHPPKSLIGESPATEDYDRISVAYGLSFDNLGEMITPDKIRDYWIDKVYGDGARNRNEYIEN